MVQPWGDMGFRLFPGYFVRVPPRPLRLYDVTSFCRRAGLCTILKNAALGVIFKMAESINSNLDFG